MNLRTSACRSSCHANACARILPCVCAGSSSRPTQGEEDEWEIANQQRMLELMSMGASDVQRKRVGGQVGVSCAAQMCGAGGCDDVHVQRERVGGQVGVFCAVQVCGVGGCDDVHVQCSANLSVVRWVCSLRRKRVGQVGVMLLMSKGASDFCSANVWVVRWVCSVQLKCVGRWVQ